MFVPFIDLKMEYRKIKEEIDEAVERVIDGTQFIQGEDVQKFEREFADYLGAQYCITVNSGTDALILGLKGLDLEPGDEVIVPSNTFIATALAVSENRLKPVFVDVDENDYGINIDDLRKKINYKTKAIILVHLYGQPDKIDEVKDIIKSTKRKIYLIEDACQAHGAEYKAKKVGNFGVFSAFSFYPTKNLGSYGDGGAIVTNDLKLAKKYKLYREYGQNKKYIYEALGRNSRLDTIQAAILRVKLKYLDEWNMKRRRIAFYYTKLFNREIPFIKTPKEFKERQSVFHLYVVRTRKRNSLLKYLNENGIQSLIHYPTPLHLQKVYKYLNYKKGELPISEKISSEIISLPIFPEMKVNQVEFVVKKIRSFYEK